MQQHTEKEHGYVYYGDKGSRICVRSVRQWSFENLTAQDDGEEGLDHVHSSDDREDSQPNSKRQGRNKVARSYPGNTFRTSSSDASPLDQNTKPPPRWVMIVFDARSTLPEFGRRLLVDKGDVDAQ